jgi:hypothetical protein
MRRPIWINKAFREFETAEGRHRWKKEHSLCNELLDAYKNGIVSWTEFESRFIKGMDKRPSAHNYLFIYWSNPLHLKHNLPSC